MDKGRRRDAPERAAVAAGLCDSLVACANESRIEFAIKLVSATSVMRLLWTTMYNAAALRLPRLR